MKDFEIYPGCDDFGTASSNPLRRREARLVFFSPAVFLLLPLVPSPAPIWCAPFVLGGALLWAAAFVAFIVRRERWTKQYQSRLDEALDNTSYQRMQAAQSLYENDQWAEALIECHETHMPGDCPLCGAES